MKIQKIIACLLAMLGPLILLPQISGADPLDNWHWRNPVPTGNDLTAVTYGNGIFVAVGAGGTILTSPDGVTWTQGTSGTFFSLNAVSYGNGIFVVVGDNGTILTSPNGVTWTERMSGVGSLLQGVTYGNDIFVAVGGNSNDCYCKQLPIPEIPPCPPCPAIILTSPDGINWTSKILGTVRYGLTGVIYGNGIFVAFNPFDSAFVSSNGVDWSSIPGRLRALTYGGGIFLGIGSDDTVQTSLDGVKWTTKTSQADFIVYAITYGNGTFVAVGYDTQGTILTSPDGETWKRISWPAGEYHYLRILVGVTYGNGTFVAVGDRGTILTTSDGVTWAAKTSRVTSEHLRAVAYGDGTYVAVGQGSVGTGFGGVIVTSIDGLNWTLISSGRSSGVGFDLHAVAYGNGTFVAVGYDYHTQQNGILTSPDGVTWTTGVSASSLEGVTYGNGKFVIVGYKTILTSPDGVTWSKESSVDASLNAVTYGNGTFVAVGPPILTSQDAVNWTPRVSPPIPYGLFGITYGNGIFVAVGSEGRIVTSPDGMVWTERSSGLVPYSSPLWEVAYGNGTFIAVGWYGAILTSSDGMTWTRREVFKQRLPGSQLDDAIHLSGATHGNGTFIAIGDLGTIVESDPGVCTLPIITTQPQRRTILSGEQALLFVIASDSTPLTYQWYQGVSGDTSKPKGTNSSSYTTAALTQTTSYWVRVSNFCGYADSDTATVTIETISAPNTPNGPVSGNIGETYTYSTGGSTSNLGHAVEYQFDWKGDGSDLSNWGSASQSKTWTMAGLYNVRARARCSQDVSVISDWSNPLSVGISVPKLSITPSAYDFGDVKVKRRMTTSFVVENTGMANLFISTATITGADPSSFTLISGRRSKTVKPGKRLTIMVAFKPKSQGSKSANLEITSNDPITPTIDVPLSGTGQ